MTEYWVSQSKHWCDVCKCWLNDTPQSRANHEKGSGHKINVQRKLREMRLKAEKEKKDEARTQEQLEQIEKAADRAYAKDLEALDEQAGPMPPPAHPPPQFGSWARTPDSKYWYNEHLRWYYDEKTRFYYGGEPPGWTQNPSIPDGARFENLHRDADSGVQKTVVRGKLPADLANLGGYKAPTEGKFTRGVQIQGSTSQPADSTAAKRARTDSLAGAADEAGLSKKEKEERQRREAAKQRVQARTAAAFGLG